MKSNSDQLVALDRRVATAPPPGDYGHLDREASLLLVESLFRWALKHTGLSRVQVIEQLKQDDPDITKRLNL